MSKKKFRAMYGLARRMKNSVVHRERATHEERLFCKMHDNSFFVFSGWRDWARGRDFLIRKMSVSPS